MTPVKLTSASSEISWEPETRLARVRYTPGATLTLKDSDFLVQALTGWIGAEGEPFAVLAYASGLRGTDAEYRAKTSAFFRRYRDIGYIALIDVGPVIRIVVELFRVGTGIQLKTFTSEAAAHEWLRTMGIAA